jgi:hypothetical protein
MGNGPFATGPVADRLTLRATDQNHGLVEPDCPMLLSDFQAALAATRDRWTIDET